MPLESKRIECPACGSSDGFAEDKVDGSGHCFSCDYHRGGSTVPGVPAKRDHFKKVIRESMLSAFEIKPIGSRKLDKKTCERYQYGVAEYKGQTVQVASYWDESGDQIVAQQIRFPNKEFRILGDSDQMGLWGKAHMQEGGRLLVITEGEIDAMSVSQAMGNSWPVVSIPRGVKSVRKAIKKDLAWINKFQEVVLCFDEDERGREAVEEARGLLPVGKVKITKLPLKDASEMLKAGRGKDLVTCVWNAPKWTPASIISGDSILERALNRDIRKAGDYPWEGLNRLTAGARYRELVTICAGSGIGKSSLCREIAASFLEDDQSVGYIALEEAPQHSALGIYGIHANRPLVWSDPTPGDVDAIRTAHSEWGSKLFLFDHFGCSDTTELLGTIRYLATGLDCRVLVLDHVSIVISGMDTDDERRAIDRLMTDLRKLVEETGILLFLVSHVKRPMGKGHEDGAEISLSQLRGSAAIAQLSDLVLGLERNQQAGEEVDRNRTQVRVLKNRFNGKTGPCSVLVYNTETGRMLEQKEEVEHFDTEDSDFEN